MGKFEFIYTKKGVNLSLSILNKWVKLSLSILNKWVNLGLSILIRGKTEFIYTK